ncbi:alpha/beta-hydrolase [Meredithblackwellia eburnea MCA 4105]
MYIDLPEYGVKLFAVVNPPDLSSPSLDLALPEPTSCPLDMDKHTIFFIHAATFTLASWAPQFSDPRLSTRYNLIAFDARFHGRTQGEEVAAYSMEELANMYISALDKLGVKQYSIVGEGSLGATCGTLMALERKDDVSSMVLVAPGQFAVEEGPQNNERKGAWLLAALSQKDGKGDGSGTIAKPELEFLEDVLFGVDDKRTTIHPIKSDWTAAFQARYGTGKPTHDLKMLVLSMIGRHGKGISMEDRASLTLPILILHGSDDDMTSPQETAEMWRDAFKNAKGGCDFRIVTGAPHLLMLTDASVANRMLISFIDRHRDIDRPPSLYI